MNAELKIRELIEKSVSEIIRNIIQKGLGVQSFSKIIEKTTEVVHQLGTTLIEELISEMDELYNAERDRKLIQMRNRKTRKMLTQIGEINLQRRLYLDKQTGYTLIPYDFCQFPKLGVKETKLMFAPSSFSS